MVPSDSAKERKISESKVKRSNQIISKRNRDQMCRLLFGREGKRNRAERGGKRGGYLYFVAVVVKQNESKNQNEKQSFMNI